jgi:hypothetical protein
MATPLRTRMIEPSNLDTQIPSRRVITHCLAEISEHGWTELQLPYDVGLVDFAREFGTPVASRFGGPLLDKLSPRSRMEARANTMSSRFGLGALPYHTDAPYFRTPPRFVFLRLAEGASSETSTTLISAQSLGFSRSDLNLLSREIWVVGQNAKRFYASILSQCRGKEQFFRYDPCCMRPLIISTNSSQHIIKSRLDTAVPHNVHWTPGKAIIFDNWNVMHARQIVTSEDQCLRALERVMVSSSDEGRSL